jgi:hypothetical protein
VAVAVHRVSFKFQVSGFKHSIWEGMAMNVITSGLD